LYPGLLEVPLDLVRRVAEETGYPANALLFVLESLVRAGHIAETEGEGQEAWALEAGRTALEVCATLSRSAVERFRQEVGLVLDHWKLRRGKDLGALLAGLARSGALTLPGEGGEQLLQRLSVMEAALVVEA
jgi:hypothetical protein